MKNITLVEDNDGHHNPSLPNTETFVQQFRAAQGGHQMNVLQLKYCSNIATQGKFCVRVHSLQV